MRERLSSDEPFLTARIGAVEFSCISGYLNEKAGSQKYLDYIFKKTDSLSLNDNVISQAHICAGIFPPKRNIIEKFAELSLKDLKEIDVLGVWLKEEHLLNGQIQDKVLVPLSDIEPYYHRNPWTEALKGKKVLV
ncbi:MAG: hypothetical protein AAGL29_16355, partial [Bacteroidota bacterium]